MNGRATNGTKGMRAAEFSALRAATCDELVQRVAALESADPPLDLHSHELTHKLVDEASLLDNRAYKHRGRVGRRRPSARGRRRFGTATGWSVAKCSALHRVWHGRQRRSSHRHGPNIVQHIEPV